MQLFSIIIGLLLMCSCNRDNKSKKASDNAVPERGELSIESQLLLGNRLFSEKTCITCHDLNKNNIGPSIREIMTIYKEKNGDITAFLKGQAKPIVDTTSSQVAIMQANIDGFLKIVSDEEMKTIAIYMLHVDELNQ
ncbi:c-type cytochrome [Arenibacter algicola]|uniref:c-type cytochrome n=1 Tax=Arenibacter algicola TaxID=616991 RepID=UPI0004DED6D0|nr:c-type cytochrome [Arenibacter algicola]|tara:strand:- start:1007 stop:1417 length:411 start_codon:yes stop_codon:yes gene_type:complete